MKGSWLWRGMGLVGGVSAGFADEGQMQCEISAEVGARKVSLIDRIQVRDW